MKKQLLLTGIGITALVLFAASCEKFLPALPEPDAVMDAPLDGLNSEQNRVFLQGAAEFDEVYIASTGLGPIFVSNSCASCHGADNRGHLSTILTRFGQSEPGNNSYLDRGGPQIQHLAIPNFLAEALPEGLVHSRFIAPIVSGTGFLELVSDADIMAMTDPDDSDGDGISGVPNWRELPAYVQPLPGAVSQNGKFICRFGRKASTYNLLQQTVTAFNEDMGISTSFLPHTPYNYEQGTNPVNGGTPEVTDEGVNGLVFYLQALQTPLQRNADDPLVAQGKSIFMQIGCESCHRESLKTQYSPIEALSEKTFHPYTDLLLHDMGLDLNDGYTEGSALAPEWRTSPLWGLGLAVDAQGGHLFLMHDGRARSIEDAIELHGGESSASRDKYRALNVVEKQALLAFLNSL